MILRINNSIPLRGTVDLPPSKSEAIRASLLLALSGAAPEDALMGYEGASVCLDTAAAIESARGLERGGGGLRAGASAALLRMLLPVCLALFSHAEIKAEEGLLARGHAELESALGVELTVRDGVISARKKLLPGRYRVDCSRSSQFLSGLLLALPLLSGDSEIELCGARVSMGYADMTLRYARAFGAVYDADRVEPDTRLIRVSASSFSKAEPFYLINGCPAYASGARSYAAFFLAANAMGGEVGLSGLDDSTLQPDAAFPELVGRERISLDPVPDLLPPLAAAAGALPQTTLFTGTGRLKYKESDRPRAMARLVNALGGGAEAGKDTLAVHGGRPLAGGECFPENDHRLAMAAAMLAPLCKGPVLVHDAECVSKSAPDFWKDYQKLGGEYELIRE